MHLIILFAVFVVATLLSLKFYRENPEGFRRALPHIRVATGVLLLWLGVLTGKIIVVILAAYVFAMGLLAVRRLRAEQLPLG